MRQLVSHVSTDYAAFAVTAIIVLIVTFIYLYIVSIPFVSTVHFDASDHWSLKSTLEYQIIEGGGMVIIKGDGKVLKN